MTADRDGQTANTPSALADGIDLGQLLEELAARRIALRRVPEPEDDSPAEVIDMPPLPQDLLDIRARLEGQVATGRDRQVLALMGEAATAACRFDIDAVEAALDKLKALAASGSL